MGKPTLHKPTPHSFPRKVKGFVFRCYRRVRWADNIFLGTGDESPTFILLKLCGYACSFSPRSFALPPNGG